MSEAERTGSKEGGGWSIGRPLAVLLVLLGLTAVLRATGVVEPLDVDRMRQRVAEAGALGPALYLTLLIGGNLVQVPGWLFHGVAVAVWGPWPAFALTWVGFQGAAGASFALARVSGATLGAAPSARAGWVQRLLDQVRERPTRSVGLLRLVTMVTPQVSLALAFTGIPYRAYAVGTALGTLPPLALLTLGLAGLWR